MDALPVEPPALHEAATAAKEGASSAEVQSALAGVRGAFPRTRFDEAWASPVPGLVALRLGNGQVAYTDKQGRYLLLGLILDSKTGIALDRQLDGRPE